MSRALIIALVPAVLALSAPAFAAGETEFRSQRVEHADLDLDNPAGAEVMLRRLNRAAQSVCGDYRGRMPIETRSAIRECVEETLQRAVSELDHPTVSAMHRGHTRIAMREE